MSDTRPASAGARELAREIADLLAVPAVDANALGLAALIDRRLRALRIAAYVASIVLPHAEEPIKARLRRALEKWTPHDNH